MLNVSYFFYYHLNPKFPKDKIVEYINNKEYDSFMKEYNKWGNFYLPSDAFVYADEDYDHNVSADITLQHNFEQITFCEYECG